MTEHVKLPKSPSLLRETGEPLQVRVIRVLRNEIAGMDKKVGGAPGLAVEVTYNPLDRLREDYGATSLDMVAVAIGLEQEFGIETIPDKAIEEMKTLSSVYAYLEDAEPAK